MPASIVVRKHDADVSIDSQLSLYSAAVLNSYNKDYRECYPVYPTELLEVTEELRTYIFIGQKDRKASRLPDELLIGC